MSGFSLRLQKRIDDMDQSTWVAFAWRLLLVVACSRIWLNRVLWTSVPLDGTNPSLSHFTKSFGLKPWVENGSWRFEWETLNILRLNKLDSEHLPTASGIWIRHILAILLLTTIWFLLGRLRQRMVNRYGPNLTVFVLLFLSGLALASGLELMVRLVPGTFVFYPPLVPIVGGWMSTYIKVPETWHLANLALFLAEFLIILSQGRVLLSEARQGALRSRMAPHFLFNALNTLHAQIEADPSGAQETTERLSGIFRQVLEVSEQPTVPLRKELAFVEDYLGIERERLGSRLNVEVEITDDAAEAHIPVMGLQILVENAIRHGIEPRVEGGKIQVDAVIENRSVRVSVTDSGDGSGGVGSGNGKALDNLRARLVRTSDLTMGPVSSGFQVSFVYPLSR